MLMADEDKAIMHTVPLHNELAPNMYALKKLVSDAQSLSVIRSGEVG